MVSVGVAKLIFGGQLPPGACVHQTPDRNVSLKHKRAARLFSPSTIRRPQKAEHGRENEQRKSGTAVQKMKENNTQGYFYIHMKKKRGALPLHIVSFGVLLGRTDRAEHVN